MSRQIDFGSKLSDDDREWLLRNNGEEQVRRNDAQFNREPDEGDYAARTGVSVPLMSGQEPSRTSDRRTPTGLVPDDPAAMEKAQRDAQFRAALEDESDGDGSESGEPGTVYREGTEGVDSYDTWSKEDLQAECERRELARSGNKPDLVSRLRADDEEQAGADE